MKICLIKITHSDGNCHYIVGPRYKKLEYYIKKGNNPNAIDFVSRHLSGSNAEQNKKILEEIRMQLLRGTSKDVIDYNYPPGNTLEFNFNMHKDTINFNNSMFNQSKTFNKTGSSIDDIKCIHALTNTSEYSFS